MRKTLAVFSILLTGLTFAVISSCGSIQKHTNETIVAPYVQLAFDASVAIEMRSISKDEKIGTGSGVIIGYSPARKARILTCAHLVTHAVENQGLLVAIINDKPVLLLPLKVDPRVDLALLEAFSEISKTSFAVLAREAPKKGERVWTIGSTNGIPLTITGGDLSNKITLKNVKIYMVSTPAYFGNSGGGVFNRRQELVGIFFAVRMGVVGIADGEAIRAPIDGGGLAVALEEIKKFLGK